MEVPNFPGKEEVEPFQKTEPLYFSGAQTVKLFGQPLIEGRNLLLRLSKIRDFTMLLMSYPMMRTVHDSKLKAWIREASIRRHSVTDLEDLLTQMPLKCFQGLLPMHVLKSVERGRSPVFSGYYMLPKAILTLAVNLAVDQLLQTLLSEDDYLRNIHHVLLSTRHRVEKRLVMEKIESVLKDNEVMLRETFSGVLQIDASVYQSQVEVRVRRQIAQQLQLPIIEGNDERLITSIEKEMSGKKYLVFLVDGDEEHLDSRRLGFSEEGLAGIVVFITTESSREANDEFTFAMNLNINTKDHLLPWVVFCQTIGNEFVLRLSKAIQTFAVRIVEECRGHLLAIIIVARSLKNVEVVQSWESALTKLCWPHLDYTTFYGQSRVMVNAFVHFIWFEISMIQKHCVTFCLFVPNIKDGKLESELICDWISSTLVVAGEAEHHLSNLVDRFVLLRYKDAKSRYVQMPEDIYTILQSLTTENPFFMKKSELGLVEPPNTELWQHAVHIELAKNNLSELPLSPNCLELKILMLQSNDDLTKFPPLFFSKMPKLCILDLSYTSVRELPDSFFELDQLKELYMKGCKHFMKLPSEVGKLKKLQKLDLDKTQIIHLPKEIQELTNLQSLTLCFYEYRGKKSIQYTCSTIVPSGVISRLAGIKHLSIDVDPDDERWEGNVQVILPEILSLECLQTVSLYIPKPELLYLIPTRIFKLDFRFIVGQHTSRMTSGAPPTDEEKFKQHECSLKLVKGVDVCYDVKNAIKHCKALFLDRHMTIKDLSVFGMMNIEQLQLCILAECKEMQTIANGRCSSIEDIFPRLLLLSVSYMKNLRSIFEGPVHSSHCFGMLKYLALHHCPNLTVIFTLEFLGNLSLLKVVVVKNCPNISALITCGSSKPKGGTFLPKLRTMLLLHLPKLTSISSGLQMGTNLEKIGIYNCPKLQSLSKMELSSQNLKVIKGETKWWEALKWSEVEWETVGRPSKFDCIFSSTNQQADIMSQLDIDENMDDCPVDRIGDELSQLSSDKDCMDEKQIADASDRKTTPTWEVEGSCSNGYSWMEYGKRGITEKRTSGEKVEQTQESHQESVLTFDFNYLSSGKPSGVDNYGIHNTEEDGDWLSLEPANYKVVEGFPMSESEFSDFAAKWH